MQNDNLLIQPLYDNLYVIKPITIYYNKISLTPEFMDRLKENIAIAIAKRPSGKLNKEVTTLNNEGRIQLAFSSRYTDTNDLVYGGVVSKLHKFKHINVDILYSLLNTDPNEMLRIIYSYLEINQELMQTKIKNDINKIDVLTNKLKKVYSMILDKIDYSKLIEITYFAYMKYLANIGAIQNKKLRYELVDIHLLHFMNMYTDVLKYSGVKLTGDKIELFKIILYYAFLTEYSTTSPSKILNMLGQLFDKDLIKYIRQLIPDYSKYPGIDGLSKLMAELNIINITPVTIKSIIEKIYGKSLIKAYNTDFMSVITMIAVSDECTNLFDYKEPKKMKNIIMDLKQKILNSKKYMIKV